MKIIFFALLLFSFGCSKEWFDITEPSISAFSPADRSQGVSLDPEIYIEFSKDMDRLKTEKAFSITGGNSSPKGNFRWHGKRLYFELLGSLENGKEYTISLFGSAEDSNGNNIKLPFSASFTPGIDVIHPELLSFSCGKITEDDSALIPLYDGMSGVDKNDSIAIEFSEPVSMETVFDNITVTPAVLIQRQITGTKLKLVPYEGFVNGTRYTVTVKTGVSDLSGNNLRKEKTVSFICGTDFTKPDLSAGGKVVCLESGSELEPFTLNNGIAEKDSRIRINFSEPMNRISVIDSISIYPAVEYDIVFSDENLYADICLKDDSFYVLDKVYSMEINKTAKDISGNTLDSDYSYTFRINGIYSKPVSVSEILQMKPDSEGNASNYDYADISLPYSAINMSPDFFYQIDKNPVTGDSGTLNIYVIRIKFQSSSADINLRRIDYISAIKSVSFTDAGYHGSLSEFILPGIYKIAVPESDPYSIDLHLYNLEPDHYYRLDIRGGISGIKDSCPGFTGNYMLIDFSAILGI